MENKLPQLVIVGASGHGLVVHDLVLKAGGFDVIGFLDSHKFIGGLHAGSPVLGSVESVEELRKLYHFTHCLIAIGDNHVRRLCVKRLKELSPALLFPSVVHPRAELAAGVELREGAVIMAGCVVGPDCTIGAHCILNTRSSLDHESMMGDFSSLAPGVVTGGKVSIGSGSAICLAAAVAHSVVIGEECVVGAGSLVLDDVRAGCVAYGRPAKYVRARLPSDPYL